MQGERSPLVDAVVEHEVGSWVAEDQIAREPPQARVMQVGQRVHGVGSRFFGPQPFGVAGEALVEPDVAPAADPDAVAEPLMGQLVGDEALGVRIEVVRAEDGEPLGFEGDLEGVRGDDDRAVLLRIGPEGLLEEVQHAGHIAEGLGHRGRERRRMHETHRTESPLGVAADVHGGEVCRHRDIAGEFPLRTAAHPLRRERHAGGRDAIALVGRDDDPVARSVVRPVVAGEPGRRPGRLARHE